MKHVSFLGAGSWGTALAILCANNGHQVTIWSKVKAETDMLKEHREHLERLPGVKLPDSIVIEEDLEKACTNQDVIVWSVASPFVRSTAQEAKKEIKQVIEGVNCAKAAMALANKNHVTMPIVEQINAILFSDKTAEQAVADLLMRDKASEYKSLTW